MIKCSSSNLFLLGTNVSLLSYKWLIAIIVAVITLTTGFTSLHFIRRYQHLLSTGDAFTDGIFLGTAVFHLFPDAIQGLSNEVSVLSSCMLVIVFIGCGFLLLFSLERSITRREQQSTSINQIRTVSSAWMLTGILSIHAFIAGAALGISDKANVVSILLIVILAHKGFEGFILMMELHYSSKNARKIKGTLWAFSFVTPFGIIVTAFIESFLQTQAAVVITSLFNAFAAGSFFYIGTLHTGHEHFHPLRGDPLKRYQKVLATLFGIIVMAVMAIWWPLEPIIVQLQ